jgi:phage/plasmid-like protein (TIGR03299 family)
MLLDAILSGTTYAPSAPAPSGQPVIVSESHNVQMINWVNGVMDPGEMIACGYLPNIRRMAGEQDEAYAARITPIVMALPIEQQERIMDAAIKRASLDTSNGRIALMVAGDKARAAHWHKLGVSVQDAVSAADAIRLAGLNWEVLKIPMSYEYEGKTHVDSEVFALVRADTGAKVGTVGARYQVIQNAHGFDFLDKVLSEFGAVYETAGAIYGGKKVWMQARFPHCGFTLPGGDENAALVMFSNSHGGEAAFVFPTVHRAVCANTRRIAMKDTDKGFSIRHTGSIKGKVDKARSLLGLSVKGFEKEKECASEMVLRNINVEKYAADVLDIVLDVTSARDNVNKLSADPLTAVLEVESAQNRLDRILKRKVNILEEILNVHESKTCLPHGSAWAGYNAFSETADHGSMFRFRGETDRDSRQLESILAGDADAAKQTAWAMAQ